MRFAADWQDREPIPDMRSAQPDRRDPAVLAYRAGARQDLALAGLEHRLEVEPRKSKIARRNGGSGGAEGTRAERDLRGRLELEHGPRHARELVMDEDEDRLL